MEKTVIIPPANPRRLWLRISALLLLSFFIVALLAVALLNGGWPNHLLNPVAGYFSMFQLIWPEQPLGALQFIATKSFVVIAHQDPRSQLNLWTLEYDAITLAVYVLAALLGGWLAGRALLDKGKLAGLVNALLGSGLLALSVTYMSAIEHCSGPTWVGFVSLYGMGFDGFELYPFYQWLVALLGIGLLGRGLLQQRRV